jgi:hypothetical protein
MFRLHPTPTAAPPPTPADMDIRLQSMARQKLLQAYAAIPDNLYSLFPPLQDTTPRHQRAREWDDDSLLASPRQPTQVTDTS